MHTAAFLFDCYINVLKGSIESTVSDETMFRLDAGLAAVFRERMKGTRKASASTLEQIHQFRMKCFDLLLFVVSHEEGGKFTAVCSSQ